MLHIVSDQVMTCCSLDLAIAVLYIALSCKPLVDWLGMHIGDYNKDAVLMFVRMVAANGNVDASKFLKLVDNHMINIRNDLNCNDRNNTPFWCFMAILDLLEFPACDFVVIPMHTLICRSCNLYSRCPFERFYLDEKAIINGRIMWRCETCNGTDIVTIERKFDGLIIIILPVEESTSRIETVGVIENDKRLSLTCCHHDGILTIRGEYKVWIASHHIESKVSKDAIYPFVVASHM